MLCSSRLLRDGRHHVFDNPPKLFSKFFPGVTASGKLPRIPSHLLKLPSRKSGYPPDRFLYGFHGTRLENHPVIVSNIHSGLVADNRNHSCMHAGKNASTGSFRAGWIDESYTPTCRLTESWGVGLD